MIAVSSSSARVSLCISIRWSLPLWWLTLKGGGVVLGIDLACRIGQASRYFRLRMSFR